MEKYLRFTIHLHGIVRYKTCPSAQPIKHYAIKTYGEVDVYIYIFIDLGTSWR
jgi:hypothetical protein